MSFLGQEGYEQTEVCGAVLVGEPCPVECATGYNHSDAIVPPTCGSGAQWINATGCVKVMCTTPVVPVGYEMVTECIDIDYLGTCDTRCSTGYIGTPDAVECQIDGTWTPFSGCTYVSNNQDEDDDEGEEASVVAYVAIPVTASLICAAAIAYMVISSKQVVPKTKGPQLREVEMKEVVVSSTAVAETISAESAHATLVEATPAAAPVAAAPVAAAAAATPAVTPAVDAPATPAPATPAAATPAAPAPAAQVVEAPAPAAAPESATKV